MLKKLAAVLVVIILIYAYPTRKPIFYDAVGKYTYFIGKSSSNCHFLTVPSEEAISVRKSLKNVCGEAVEVEDEDYFITVIDRLEAEFLFEEKVDEIVCRYYYSSKISTYKSINGIKVNLQTTYGTTKTIASPINFGSF